MFKDTGYNENKEVSTVKVKAVATFREEEGLKIEMGTQRISGVAGKVLFLDLNGDYKSIPKDS